MSLSAREQSRTQGEPRELYLFVYGSDPSDVAAYTNHDQVISYAGVDYQPIPIDRGNVVTSGSLDRASMEISIPNDDPLLDVFAFYPPDSVVMLYVRQGHINESVLDFRLVWAGRILSFKEEEEVVNLTAEPISTSMKRIGLRRHYMRGCPHVLYGAKCQADKVAATTTVVVTNVNSPLIDLQSGWSSAAPAPEKYLGGMMEWTDLTGRTRRRSILQIISANRVLLSGPATGMISGQDVDVVLGCNHQHPDDCVSLHNNGPNYGGQKWIPTENPTGLKNNFY